MINLEKHFKNIESKINSLPERLNFKIGEVSSILGAPNHVLRYWEKEFPTLKPDKFINNQRIYFKKDIKILLLIKALLYEEKFSIEGLRKHLNSYYQQLKNYNSKDSVRIEQKLKGLLNSLSKMRETLSQASM
ncbi:MAG: MerR family transcriptional regulator [Oligoflexia bacterium]|nr:MerR family transcriptional regulator [Oligoflexia bacterium]